MKFHITITDIEEGETLVDTDTNAIVAAIEEAGYTRAVQLTHCHVTDHAAALCAVLEMAEEAKQKKPIIAVLMDMYFSDKTEKDETDTETQD